MSSNNRSIGRDVHLYGTKASENAEEILGGLELNQGVTKANFYSMVEIFVSFESDYFLLDEDSKAVPRDHNALQPGTYTITNESPLLRSTSMSTGTRVRTFRDSVRDRDKRCLISGDIAQDRRGNWRGCDAAHIFPLAYEGHWQEHDYGRWITIPASQGGSINSIQNGLLLRSDLHHLFDGYDISINPDDDYKIVVFNTDIRHVSGRQLDDQFRNDPRRASDQLLRWHFRQAVLANVKGAGVPVFEHDFPSGSDMLGDIRRGPLAKERMEFELFSRLRASQSA